MDDLTSIGTEDLIDLNGGYNGCNWTFYQTFYKQTRMDEYSEILVNRKQLERNWNFRND